MEEWIDVVNDRAKLRADVARLAEALHSM